MKKMISTLLAASVVLSHSPAYADGLEQFQKETNLIWSPEEQGQKDNTQDAQIGKSMLTWGIGLAVVIGVVFGLIKSYNSSN